jgi:hypothetical protein
MFYVLFFAFVYVLMILCVFIYFLLICVLLFPHSTQDFLQVVSMFSGFQFDWPPTLLAVYKWLSFTNFNLELVAPECNFRVEFSARWYIVQSLPVVFACSIILVLVVVRTMQCVQRSLLKRLPFGSISGTCVPLHLHAQ